MSEQGSHFHLFAYGSLRKDGPAAARLRDCEFVGNARVGGVLYDVDGKYRALVIYGNAPIEGDVWRCPNELLASLDSYEGIEEGLFRRIGANVRMMDTAETVGCWVYVAGPALSRKLLPARRI